MWLMQNSTTLSTSSLPYAHKLSVALWLYSLKLKQFFMQVPTLDVALAVCLSCQFFFFLLTCRLLCYPFVAFFLNISTFHSGFSFFFVYFLTPFLWLLLLLLSFLSPSLLLRSSTHFSSFLFYFIILPYGNYTTGGGTHNEQTYQTVNGPKKKYLDNRCTFKDYAFPVIFFSFFNFLTCRHLPRETHRGIPFVCFLSHMWHIFFSLFYFCYF